jgi:hypothetical protein
VLAVMRDQDAVPASTATAIGTLMNSTQRQLR